MRYLSKDVSELVEPVSEDVRVRTEEENVDEEAPNGLIVLKNCIRLIVVFIPLKMIMLSVYLEIQYADTEF